MSNQDNKPNDNIIIEVVSTINDTIYAVVNKAVGKAPAPIKAGLFIMSNTGGATEVAIASDADKKEEIAEFVGSILGALACSLTGGGVVMASAICSTTGGEIGKETYNHFTESKEQTTQNPQLARDRGIDIEGIIEEVKQESPVVRQQIEDYVPSNHTTDPDMVPDPGNHGGDGDDWNDDAQDDMGDPNWDSNAEGFSWDDSSSSDGGGDSGGKPVLIDLEGDGIKLTALYDSNTYFDFDNDGIAEKTAWTQDAILFFDENDDKTITHAREIAFSQYTDADDTDLEALAAAFDSNHDGVLDANDRHFEHFKLWKDFNANGVVDSDELQTLAESDIAAIGLVSDGRQQVQADGSIIFGESSYTTTDGSTGSVTDVMFRYSNKSTD